MKNPTIMWAFFFVMGVVLGCMLENNRLLNPIDVTITQQGQAGYLPPVMRYGELIGYGAAMDTVQHGGQLYTPTVYYYTYRIDLKKIIK